MFRRLTIQRLEDRRLLAAQPFQPVGAALQSNVRASIESRLSESELLANLGANAANENAPSATVGLPLKTARVTGLLLQSNASEKLAGIELFLSPTFAADRAGAIASIADRLRQLAPPRPVVEEAFAIPLSSETQRELLEVASEIIDWAIERIDAEDADRRRIASNFNVPSLISDAIRTQVRDRLEARQSAITSTLQVEVIRDVQPLAPVGTQAQQLSAGSATMNRADRSDLGLEVNHWSHLDSIANFEQQTLKRSDFSQSPSANSFVVGELQTQAKEVFPDSEVPSNGMKAHSVDEVLEVVMAEYNEPVTAAQTEGRSEFELVERVGRASSLDLLSALDATTTEVLAAVKELRPRLNTLVAVCVSTLTASYILRTQRQKSKNKERDFDPECATLKLADRTPRPNFGL
jgi:hypothetical protein